MRRIVILFGVMALLFTPWLPAARADSLTLRLGASFPRGNSDIWDVNKMETDLQMTDLIGGYVGVNYEFFMSDVFSFTVGLAATNSRETVEDLDFVFPDGFPILHDIELTIVPLEAGVKWSFLGRNRRVIPYLGGGLGLYIWEYRETGDFVVDRDFYPVIVSGDFEGTGADLGLHVEFGLRFPFGRRTSIDWEVKYIGVEGDLGPDFDPSFDPIDLSSWVTTLGISFWW